MAKITRGLKTIFHRLMRGILYTAAGLLTLTIFANGYETVSGKDMPFLGSVSQVNLDGFQPTLAKYPFEHLTRSGGEGNFGRPETLRLVVDKKPLKIVIAPAMQHNNRWLARANTSHVIYTSETKDGQSADMLIYMKQSWRTVTQPEKVTRGSNLFIDTHLNWRYMFRVQEIRTIDTTAQTIIPDTDDTQLILTINSQDNSHAFVIYATFLSLNNIGVQ